MHEPKRASDFSKWLAFGDILSKYKPLIWLLILILVAAGFGFRTPKMLLDDIKENIKVDNVRDSLMREDIVSLKEVTKIQSQVINSIIVAQCLTLTKRDGQLTGLCK